MINQSILDIVSKEYTYEVVGKCNGCQLCEFLAVENFGETIHGKGYKVVKQPVTWEEKEQCFEAMERCPIGGIVRTEQFIQG
jgi:ferredoxin